MMKRCMFFIFITAVFVFNAAPVIIENEPADNKIAGGFFEEEWKG